MGVQIAHWGCRLHLRILVSSKVLTQRDIRNT